MILEYGGRNCWSYKEWLSVSMQLNKNVPDEYGFPDAAVAPLLCFEGGNASGKTVALRVLTFIMDFCKNSFLREPEADIPFESFYLNEDPSEFYLKFCLKNDLKTQYMYELKLNRHRVLTEKLYKLNGKKQKLFTRRYNKITFNDFFGNTDSVILRNNASFFSTLFQYGVDNTKSFYDFFVAFNSNVKDYGNHEAGTKDDVAKFYYDHEQYGKMVANELHRFDTGINSIEIMTRTGIKDNKEITEYFSTFGHLVDGKTQHLPWFSESLGTIRLYNIYVDIILALNTGGMLIVDEIDTHLHSLIVPELLNYFLDPAKNKNHAQILFTSHSYDLLDQAKKYRTYLFMKEENESFCYRIDELKGNVFIRNDKPIAPLYRSGALGGLPNVAEK